METAAETHIPYTRAKQNSSKKKPERKTIPGWNEMVKPQKETARFWYHVWLSAEKPHHGELFNIMRHTRNQFRYAKRKCINAVENIKREKFIEASLKGDKNLIEEFKKFSHSS